MDNTSSPYTPYPPTATPVDTYQVPEQQTGYPAPTPYQTYPPTASYSQPGYIPDPGHVTLDVGATQPHYSQPGFEGYQQTSVPLGQEPSFFPSPPAHVPVPVDDRFVLFSRPPYEVTDDDKLWSLLAYILSPLVPILIFFMTSRRLRPFIKSHYAQAFILGSVNLVLWAVLTWITTLLFIIPFALWLGLVFLGVVAYTGNEISIPLLSNALRNSNLA